MVLSVLYLRNGAEDERSPQGITSARNNNENGAERLEKSDKIERVCDHVTRVQRVAMLGNARKKRRAMKNNIDGLGLDKSSVPLRAATCVCICMPTAKTKLNDSSGAHSSICFWSGSPLPRTQDAEPSGMGRTSLRTARNPSRDRLSIETR